MVMDRDKLKKIQEDTSHFLNINDMKEFTPAMVHKHVAAEQSFREHLVDSMDKHIEDSGKFWHDNVEQLSIIKSSMEHKIDVMFTKLDDNSKMTKEALELARNVNNTIHPLIEKLNDHEGRLDEQDIQKARLQGGFKVALWIMSAFAIVASSLYYMYIQNIKNEIKQEIHDKYQGASIQAVEERPHSGIYKINLIEK